LPPRLPANRTDAVEKINAKIATTVKKTFLEFNIEKSPEKSKPKNTC
jgi:hypothetical protein